MKEHRQNAHTGSLVFWALLCTASAGFLFHHARRIVDHEPRAGEVLAGVALLVFGPIAFTAYLVRARHVWVSADPGEGLVVGGRRIIPWADVLRIERRRPLLRSYSGPTRIAPMEQRVTSELGDGCGRFATLFRIFAFLVAGVAVLTGIFVVWLFFFVFVPLVILPVVEVFAPFGDRIRVVTRQGTFVLHDLSDPDEFERAVRAQLPARES